MVIALLPAASGTIQWSWVTPSDAEYLWSSDTGYQPMWGPSGFRMPPAQVSTSPVPFAAGSTVQRARIAERILDLPMVIRAVSDLQLWDRIEQLSGWLDPTLGDGYLKVMRPDGTTRQLRCRYRDGLTGDEMQSTRGPLWMKVVLTFVCPDAFWEDEDDTSVSFTGNNAPRSFLSAVFLPLQLTGSTILASDVIANSGGVSAWPIWTIYGPGTAPAIRNLTTGKYIKLNTTLASGERITIDTRPDAPSVIGPNGSSLIGVMSNASEMFPLEPGSNTIQVEINDSSGASAAELSFRQRYRSA